MSVCTRWRSDSFSILRFFCFYCSGDHRDLHSFPTRRSSDLGWCRSTSDGWTRTSSFPSTSVAEPTSRTVISRSEEHTSELQSRRDLVCRLLLEKKKE